MQMELLKGPIRQAASASTSTSTSPELLRGRQVGTREKEPGGEDALCWPDKEDPQGGVPVESWVSCGIIMRSPSVEGQGASEGEGE